MKKLIAFACVVLVIVCCKKKSSDEDKVEFNKQAIMENLADNIVLPGYNELDTRLSGFESSYAAFLADQSPANFTLLQDSWKETYVQWERSLMFELGPAMNELLKVSMGSFPTDTTTILNNISTGSYNLDQISNFIAQGIPAFDFLLYRPNAISYFSDSNYAQYGSDLIAKMRQHVTSVINGWNNGYTSTFKNSTGTEATSAFSLLVNSFMKSYEECKWTKIGIPIGNQSAGEAMPQYIETRRAKISFLLMRENIAALHRVFKGDQMNGTTGVGFDDYLIALEKQDLVNTINSEFEGILSLIDQHTADFESTLNNDPASLQLLYNKIHYLTVYLKTDMTSAFGVLITYQDNDGD